MTNDADSNWEVIHADQASRTWYDAQVAANKLYEYRVTTVVECGGNELFAFA